MNNKFIKNSTEVEEIKEEVKKEDMKKNKTSRLPLSFYIVIGILLCILVLIISLVIMSNSEDEVVGDPNNQEEVISKELNDTIVKKIYEEGLPFVGHYVNELNTYNTEKITFDNADKGYLRAFAFQNIDFKEEDISPIVNSDGIPECVECTFQELLSLDAYVFNADLLQESAKKLYGREIAHGNFNVFLEAGGTYKDGKYEYLSQGGTDYLSYHYREYVSFELVEDSLYIYDKYLYIYGELDSRHEHYNVEVYADSAKKKSLGKGTYLEADNLVDFIVPTYERKKANYKHEFKKSKEGHWYWVSSEPVQ